MTDSTERAHGAPWNTPDECEHPADVGCSHCCPCEDCTDERRMAEED